MDGSRFDALTRSLAAGADRRRLLAGLAGGLLGLAGRGIGAQTCREAGRLCVNNLDCCSEICDQNRCACPPGTAGCGGACLPYGRPCKAGDACCNGAACQGGVCRCPAGAAVCNTINGPVCQTCPPDQLLGSGCRCLCRSTGRPAGPDGCPCPVGQERCGAACIPAGGCCADGDCPPCNECVGGGCRAVPNLSVACDGSPLQLIGGSIACTTTVEVGVCVDGACWCGAQVYDAAANRCLCGASATADCAPLCCRVGQVCTGLGAAFGCIACP